MWPEDGFGGAGESALAVLGREVRPSGAAAGIVVVATLWRIACGDRARAAWTCADRFGLSGRPRRGSLDPRHLDERAAVLLAISSTTIGKVFKGTGLFADPATGPHPPRGLRHSFAWCLFGINDTTAMRYIKAAHPERTAHLPR
ncbi:hypothetical protein [Streptomyces violaceus]|uniref:Transposase IS701-like DDE domain-containing protein n=1 Tax=Streptomyces violaceus TaxID=1936 RepID=A0ABZ1NMI0_STRVL